MDDVIQHPPMHHPLEVSYDSIVDEPELNYQCFTLITYCHVNHPTSITPYQCSCFCKNKIKIDLILGWQITKGFLI